MAGLQLIKNKSERTFLFHSCKKLRLKIYKLGDALKLIPENVKFFKYQSEVVSYCWGKTPEYFNETIVTL